jgi:zona occludens toxin (predicted ATPase)
MKKISMAMMAAMVAFSGAAIAQAPAAPAKADAKVDCKKAENKDRKECKEAPKK